MKGRPELSPDLARMPLTLDFHNFPAWDGNVEVSHLF